MRSDPSLPPVRVAAVMLAAFAAGVLSCCQWSGREEIEDGEGGERVAEIPGGDLPPPPAMDGGAGRAGDAGRAGGESATVRPQAADGGGPVRVGTVSYVNEASRFVLIETPGHHRLEKGFPLQSFAADGGLTAELSTSPEQTSGFMTADIREGLPAVGEEVYLRYTELLERHSPRMQAEMERWQREREMNVFERRRAARKEKRAGRESRVGTRADEPRRRWLPRLRSGGGEGGAAE